MPLPGSQEGLGSGFQYHAWLVYATTYTLVCIFDFETLPLIMVALGFNFTCHFARITRGIRAMLATVITIKHVLACVVSWLFLNTK